MEYKRLITEMIEKISEEDTIFLSQIYTLIKRHVDKLGVQIRDKK